MLSMLFYNGAKYLFNYMNNIHQYDVHTDYSENGDIKDKITEQVLDNLLCNQHVMTIDFIKSHYENEINNLYLPEIDKLLLEDSSVTVKDIIKDIQAEYNSGDSYEYIEYLLKKFETKINFKKYNAQFLKLALNGNNLLVTKLLMKYLDQMMINNEYEIYLEDVVVQSADIFNYFMEKYTDFARDIAEFVVIKNMHQKIIYHDVANEIILNYSSVFDMEKLYHQIMFHSVNCDCDKNYKVFNFMTKYYEHLVAKNGIDIRRLPKNVQALEYIAQNFKNIKLVLELDEKAPNDYNIFVMNKQRDIPEYKISEFYSNIIHYNNHKINNPLELIKFMDKKYPEIKRKFELKRIGEMDVDVLEYIKEEHYDKLNQKILADYFANFKQLRDNESDNKILINHLKKFSSFYYVITNFNNFFEFNGYSDVATVCSNFIKYFCKMNILDELKKIRICLNKFFNFLIIELFPSIIKTYSLNSSIFDYLLEEVNYILNPHTFEKIYDGGFIPFIEDTHSKLSNFFGNSIFYKGSGFIVVNFALLKLFCEDRMDTSDWMHGCDCFTAMNKCPKWNLNEIVIVKCGTFLSVSECKNEYISVNKKKSAKSCGK